MAMTWREFKDAVEVELCEQGLTEDVELWYIDTEFIEKLSFAYNLEIKKLAIQDAVNIGRR